MHKFRIEAFHDHTSFQVCLKNWMGFWYSGFVWTNYFCISYESEQKAIDAIELYKKRFKEVE